MITTRNKAITKLNKLEDGLKEVIYYAGTSLLLEVGKKYIELVQDIRRNISYYGNIAHVKRVKDNILGNVNVKRIEDYIKNNLI